VIFHLLSLLEDNMNQAHLLFNLISAFESLASRQQAPGKDWSYPPTDLLKTGENSYELHFALAGTRLDQIDISSELQQLTVSVKFPEPAGEDQYVVKTIARRSFTRKFALAEHIQVGEATFVDGLLKIKLEQVIPEALKKRTIPIT
jgi:molecular chaperone IbpA